MALLVRRACQEELPQLIQTYSFAVLESLLENRDIKWLAQNDGPKPMDLTLPSWFQSQL